MLRAVWNVVAYWPLEFVRGYRESWRQRFRYVKYLPDTYKTRSAGRAVATQIARMVRGSNA